jgi:hypothetical protein
VLFAALLVHRGPYDVAYHNTDEIQETFATLAFAAAAFALRQHREPRSGERASAAPEL